MKYSFEDLDERIIKTKIALTGAILNLIRQEKKIKVLDICEVADITPMTYYHHFDNKEQLLKYVIKDQLTGILPIPSKLKPINLKHLIYYLVCSFNGFIQKNRETMCSMIKQTAYASYIFDIIRQLVKKEIQNLNLGDLFYIDFWTNIICGGLWNIFNQILINKQCFTNQKIWLSIKTLLSCVKIN